MTEAQAQTSTYGEVTQAGIKLVRVLGDLGKAWLTLRNAQRREANQQPAPTRPNPDAAIRAASIPNAVPQAASRSVEAAKVPATVPASAQASQDAIAVATAKAEQARAAEARLDTSIEALRQLFEQTLAAQRASSPSVIEAQVTRSEAAPVVVPTVTSQPVAQVDSSPAVVSLAAVAEVLPDGVPSVTEQHSPQIDASPVVETPVMAAAESSAMAEPASRDVAKTVPLSDGASPEATSTQAARTATTEKPETATNPPQTNPEPELTPAQRRAKWLVECKDPHVQSWRTIKRFVRRMTDFDLFVFTSSLTMFRGFLAMLRAMTPYYEGPKVSLDELVPNGMPLAFAMAEQNV